jgi:hypothetical protein
MLEDPGQCLGMANAVVAKRAGRDHRAARVGDLNLAARVGDLNLMEVSVGIHPDDCIHDFCQHGHWPCPSHGQRSTVGTGLGAVTEAADL